MRVRRAQNTEVRHEFRPPWEPSLKPFIRIAAVAAIGGALLVSASAVQAQSQYGQQQPDLHTMLHIRPDQEAAWRTYQSASPQPAEIAQMRQGAQQLGSLTTPERLERINGMLTTQLTVFHRQAMATRGLYSVLSPDQQRMFDQATAPPAGRGGPPQR